MLAERYQWPPAVVDSLPPDYVDELIVMLQVKREMADEAREKAEKDREKTAHLNRLRAKNRSVLSKQGLRIQA